MSNPDLQKLLEWAEETQKNQLLPTDLRCACITLQCSILVVQIKLMEAEDAREREKTTIAMGTWR